VAIVGSGPAGFYAAEALFKSDKAVQVDMFDRLPTPFGLVRGGVAPDHAKIKNVIKVYEKIAAQDGFQFLGNVNVGTDVTVDTLRRFYDAILFATGAETDRPLGIPGEDLPGSYTATEFVGWYNGHPDYRDRVFDLSQEVAVVVGQGNVAMDVTRILAKSADELRKTDIASHALEALAESKVKEIYLVGRRGPVQAKFTPAEIREIGELPNCSVVLEPNALALDPASQAELNDPDNKQAQKNMEILRDFANRTLIMSRRRYHILFYRSPIEIQGEGHVERVILEKNRLEGEPFQLRAVGTGETEVLPCGLIFRSVGYRGVPIPGLPFDERNGVCPNQGGRVADGGTAVPGLYVAGWIKRGPSGVIGTNKPCSVETVNALLEDVPHLAPCEVPDTGALHELLRSRGIHAVSFDDWRAIDAAEQARGASAGKPREKFTRIDEMLAQLTQR